MIKRLAFFILVAIMLVASLGACGSNSNDKAESVPEYPGATSLTIPETFKNEIVASLKNVKDSHVEAFKTSDTSEKIQTYFNDTYKSKGWGNKSSELGNETKDLMGQIQGFTQIYEKDNKSAVVMGFPGSQAVSLGFSGISQGDTFFMVVTGNR